MALGPFVIPQYQHHSTSGAKRAFRESFGQEWQGTDDELRAAGLRFKDLNPKGKCADFVIVMIETGNQTTQKAA